MGKAIAFATPVFFLLIALELLLARARGLAGAYRLNDAVNSLSLGVMSQVVGLFVRVFNYGVYALVFERVALGTWPDAWWAWVLAIVFYDFCYYWNHRLGHESAVFWASHVVHHQSQRYNLSTALRQTSSGAFLGWIFYLPMAVAGVPPLVLQCSRWRRSSTCSTSTGFTPKSSASSAGSTAGSRRRRTTGCTTP